MRTTTCDCCGRRRQCETQDQWYYYCALECASATKEERKQIRENRQASKKAKLPRFAYPCIGGPLDGKYAISADFGDVPYRYVNNTRIVVGEPGQYHEFQNDYYEFNSAGYSNKKIGGHPSMIYLHKSLIKPLISPRQR